MSCASSNKTVRPAAASTAGGAVGEGCCNVHGREALVLGSFFEPVSEVDDCAVAVLAQGGFEGGLVAEAEAGE
jgi:hypothetical protein